MLTAKIILPLPGEFSQANKKLSDAHDWLEHALVRNFDGFTIVDGRGAWNNGQITIIERVRIYYVTIDPLPVNVRVLREIVQHLVDTSGEECIYFRDTDGHISFITPERKI